MLHRPSEVSGFDPSLGVLGSKGETLASLRSACSESAENQAGLLGVIGNGFAYTPLCALSESQTDSFFCSCIPWVFVWGIRFLTWIAPWRPSTHLNS